jgi:CubicO group peptidase (beta-lactamase class C family)
VDEANGQGACTRRSLLAGAGAGLALTLLPRSAHARGDLDRLIRGEMAAAGIPGLAVGIARRGEVLFARGYGLADLARRAPVTTDTMFHIASITKTITATAVMLLVEQGRIALDDRVAPHLGFAMAGEQAGAITFRHLLMHTSGISDEMYYKIDFRSPGADATMGLEDLVQGYLAPGGRFAASGNLKRPPGSSWDYSNVGFALLGHLVERISGTDLRDFTRERLFRPLHLRHIAWRIAETPSRLRAVPYDLVDGAPVPVQPVGFPDYPVGMIRASIKDLTRLIAASANGGAAQGARLLSSANNAQLLAMRKPPGLASWLTGQGLAWQQSLLDGVARTNHWGGDPGVFSMAYLDPDRRSAVVLLSNLSATPESRTALKMIAAQAIGHANPRRLRRSQGGSAATP